MKVLRAEQQTTNIDYASNQTASARQDGSCWTAASMSEFAGVGSSEEELSADVQRDMMEAIVEAIERAEYPEAEEWTSSGQVGEPGSTVGVIASIGSEFAAIEQVVQ